MLADPGLMVVQPVEMLDQLHVAVDREGRVLAQRMERRKEDPGAEITVLHGVPFKSRWRAYAHHVTLRRPRSGRLEGWNAHRARSPSIETHAFGVLPGLGRRPTSLALSTSQPR